MSSFSKKNKKIFIKYFLEVRYISILSFPLLFSSSGRLSQVRHPLEFIDPHPLLEYDGIDHDRLLLWKAQYLSIYDRGVDRPFVWKAQYLSIYDRGADRLLPVSQYLLSSVCQYVLPLLSGHQLTVGLLYSFPLRQRSSIVWWGRSLAPTFEGVRTRLVYSFNTAQRPSIDCGGCCIVLPLLSGHQSIVVVVV